MTDQAAPFCGCSATDPIICRADRMKLDVEALIYEVHTGSERPCECDFHRERTP